MKPIQCVLILIALSSWVNSVPAAITLVENGAPIAVIVTGNNPSPSAIKAANTLQEYIEKISGAQLEIKEDGDGPAVNTIIIGRTAAARALGVDIPSGFTSAMNEEGVVIKTSGNSLILAGNEDGFYRGTEIAVNLFLDHLGCRWFFPGQYGEVIPRMKTITIGDIDRRETPSFRFRNIWYSGWMPVSAKSRDEYEKWYDLNNLGALPESLPGDGTTSRLAPAEKYYESHPHIYAIDEKGNRMRDMLCLSEPEAVAISVKTITEYFRENPGQLTFGFAPPDGHPRCYCERCVAAETGFMGKGFGDPSFSDTWFAFANRVAEGVYREFPDRWVLTNGYANRVRIPETVPHFSPNMGIQSAMIATCTLHRTGDPHCWQRVIYREMLDQWTEKLGCVFIYDYDPGKGLDYLPFPVLHCLRHDLPYFKERNVWGFWTEGQNSWMVTHLNYYIRARLMWNVEADVDALVRDYCEKFYGAAANPVESYIWVLENAVEQAPVHATWGNILPWKHILNREVLRRLDSLMDEAMRLASTPEEKIRTGALHKVHLHMKTYVAMEHAVDRGDFRKGAALAGQMARIREEISAIDPNLLPHASEQYRNHRSTTESHQRVYESLAEKAGGRAGDLIAMTSETWEFRKDPEDLGVIYRWYLPGTGAPWESIRTTGYWESEGYQDGRGWGYSGKAWYRTAVHIPESAGGKKLLLTMGGIYSNGYWIWVNGTLAGKRNRPDSRAQGDIDITGFIKPGEINTIAILVNTDPPGRTTRSGLYRRVFIWSPKE